MFKGLILAGMCAINGMMSGPVSSNNTSGETGELSVGEEIALCCTGDSISVDCNERAAKNTDAQSIKESVGQEVDHN